MKWRLKFIELFLEKRKGNKQNEQKRTVKPSDKQTVETKKKCEYHSSTHFNYNKIHSWDLEETTIKEKRKKKRQTYK
jgi:hypothetical protein